MAHRHRVKYTRDHCYGIVGTINEDRGADGNITIEDRCGCGAVRYTNVNGLHEASTGWIAADDPHAAR